MSPLSQLALCHRRQWCGFGEGEVTQLGAEGYLSASFPCAQSLMVTGIGELRFTKLSGASAGHDAAWHCLPCAY